LAPSPVAGELHSDLSRYGLALELMRLKAVGPGLVVEFAVRPIVLMLIFRLIEIKKLTGCLSAARLFPSR
jgi:hypothetical protein